MIPVTRERAPGLTCWSEQGRLLLSVLAGIVVHGGHVLQLSVQPSAFQSVPSVQGKGRPSFLQEFLLIPFTLSDVSFLPNA